MISTKLIDGKMWVLAEDHQAALNAVRDELAVLQPENNEAFTEEQKNKYWREFLKAAEKAPPVSKSIGVSGGMGKAINWNIWLKP